ncbi:phosphoribosylglycinamide formyltransferase [Elongatibacter sediminis]|uniref:Phosphoribosylglycinamide formyltransferase n=1 Tax=Elongatibacter sediminis TaxID=3119006 RepID=A0AAW9R9C6_9GAMM
MSTRTVTVLISGTGTNLQALIDARQARRLDLEFVQVVSNRPEAPGLRRAQQAGIPVTVVDHTEFADREAFDRELANTVAQGAPDLVVLAGFMRILGPAMLQRFENRMINLHPSLLPLYRGTDTYRRALEAGDREHGASVHFVTAELDGGPVISQVRIPVETGDTPERLEARLAPREHDLLVATVELFTRHPVQCCHGSITIDDKPLARPLELQADARLPV